MTIKSTPAHTPKSPSSPSKADAGRSALEQPHGNAAALAAMGEFGANVGGETIEVLQSDNSDIDGKTPAQAIASLSATVQKHIDHCRLMVQACIDTMNDEREWENRVTENVFVSMTENASASWGGANRPNPDRWFDIINVWSDTRRRLQSALDLGKDHSQINAFGQASANQFRTMESLYSNTRGYLQGFGAYQRDIADGAVKVQGGLKLTQDICFAVAVGYAVVVLAPAAGAAATTKFGGGVFVNGTTQLLAATGIGAVGEYGMQTSAEMWNMQLNMGADLWGGKSVDEAWANIDFKGAWNRMNQKGIDGAWDGAFALGGAHADKWVLKGTNKVSNKVSPATPNPSRARVMATSIGTRGSAATLSGGTMGGLEGGIRTVAAGGDADQVWENTKNGSLYGGLFSGLFGTAAGMGRNQDMNKLCTPASSKDLDELTGQQMNSYLQNNTDPLVQTQRALFSHMQPNQRYSSIEPSRAAAADPGKSQAIIGRDRDADYWQTLLEMNGKRPVSPQEAPNSSYWKDAQTKNRKFNNNPYRHTLNEQFTQTVGKKQGNTTNIYDMTHVGPRGGWNAYKNMGWAQGIADSRKPVVLSEAPIEKNLKYDNSDLPSEQNPTFFRVEIDYLLNKGYRLDNGYTGPGKARLIPPTMSGGLGFRSGKKPELLGYQKDTIIDLPPSMIGLAVSQFKDNKQ